MADGGGAGAGGGGINLASRTNATFAEFQRLSPDERGPYMGLPGYNAFQRNWMTWRRQQAAGAGGGAAPAAAAAAAPGGWSLGAALGAPGIAWSTFTTWLRKPSSFNFEDHLGVVQYVQYSYPALERLLHAAESSPVDRTALKNTLRNRLVAGRMALKQRVALVLRLGQYQKIYAKQTASSNARVLKTATGELMADIFLYLVLEYRKQEIEAELIRAVPTYGGGSSQAVDEGMFMGRGLVTVLPYQVIDALNTFIDGNAEEARRWGIVRGAGVRELATMPTLAGIEDIDSVDNIVLGDDRTTAGEAADQIIAGRRLLTFGADADLVRERIGRGNISGVLERLTQPSGAAGGGAAAAAAVAPIADVVRAVAPPEQRGAFVEEVERQLGEDEAGVAGGEMAADGGVGAAAGGRLPGMAPQPANKKLRQAGATGASARAGASRADANGAGASANVARRIAAQAAAGTSSERKRPRGNGKEEEYGAAGGGGGGASGGGSGYGLFGGAYKGSRSAHKSSRSAHRRTRKRSHRKTRRHIKKSKKGTRRH
jgi:hypothetical protein